MDRKIFRRLAIFGLILLGASCQRNPRPPVVSGTIETDEVHVASRYGGRVIKTIAQEGDVLQPGQPIVELDASELGPRRDQSAAMLAELVAGSRVEEIQAAKNDWESQKADLDLAESDRKRALELSTQKTISDAEKDRAVAHAASLERSVSAAKSRYGLLVAGTRPERIAQARAQLAEIDTQLQEMKISAPTNSVLEVLSVKVGDVLTPNREIATLILPQHLWVRVYVPEPWLGVIKTGEPVKVTVDSFPGQDFQGEVEQINRSAEFTPRNVQTVDERVKQVFGVKVRLKNDGDKLRSGMSADILFPNLPK